MATGLAEILPGQWRQYDEVTGEYIYTHTFSGDGSWLLSRVSSKPWQRVIDTLGGNEVRGYYFLEQRNERPVLRMQVMGLDTGIVPNVPLKLITATKGFLRSPDQNRVFLIISVSDDRIFLRNRLLERLLQPERRASTDSCVRLDRM